MSGKTKGMLGCGGCGCLLTILLVVATVALPMAKIYALGWYGYVGAAPICVISGLLLIVGIVFMMKDKKAGAEDDE